MPVYRISIHDTVELARNTGFAVEAPDEGTAHARAAAFMRTADFTHDAEIHEQAIDGIDWEITSVREAVDSIDHIVQPSDGRVLVTESDWAKIQAALHE